MTIDFNEIDCCCQQARKFKDMLVTVLFSFMLVTTRFFIDHSTQMSNGARRTCELSEEIRQFTATVMPNELI